MEEQLNELYYNPKNSTAFSGAEKLFSEVTKTFPYAKIEDVKHWLASQRTYTLHKNVRKNFTRNRIIVEKTDELWQIDLCDMVKVAASNNGFKYILTVIDVLSKFSFAVPLKTKKPQLVLKALKEIFRIRKPVNIQSDKGKEFVNKTSEAFFKKHGINHYVSQNENVKCAVVERFNRTLKSKLFKYFTANDTTTYINVLNDFVNSYNNTVHSSIKMKPKDVNIDNDHIAFKNLFDGKTKREMLLKNIEPKLMEGDNVRISKNKGKFEKGYSQNFSEEIFTIKKGNAKYTQPLYKLIDEEGEAIKGSFYPEEVQRVIATRDRYYKIEKILKSRKRGRQTEYLVKWLGYPDKFNLWINSKDIINDSK
ncbi:hypothetical protein B4U80_10730 [Leptotrombidium deliense]|uniref:Uncharacterized protein n=1 Tax=Leptotrombidium deliense TaxID=299467 RepID=A0A443RZB0_9ACAR|nr:hypothetical protein B4U80_10730 [Leptotrombidium deliense]